MYPAGLCFCEVTLVSCVSVIIVVYLILRVYHQFLLHFELDLCLFFIIFYRLLCTDLSTLLLCSSVALCTLKTLLFHSVQHHYSEQEVELQSRLIIGYFLLESW